MWSHDGVSLRSGVGVVAVALGAGLCLAACSGRASPRSGDVASATRSSEQAPPASTPLPAGVNRLSCDHTVDFGLPPPVSPVAGVVKLTAGVEGVDGQALQTVKQRGPDGRAPADARLRLSAKVGLQVRADRTFQLLVPDEARDSAAIGWGNPGEPSDGVAGPGCPDTSHHSGWLSYAGAIWVAKPQCLTLHVRADNNEHDIRVGVGAPCPGQQPPPTAPW
jgi:hypothetical protein